MTAWAGIDLAAQAASTALCVLAEADGLRVARLEHGCADAELLEAVAAAERVGVDAPLGWPRAFARSLAGYVAEGRWETAGEALRVRVTDRAVTQWARSRGAALHPLSVSADRIATCAWRAARLLSASGPVDRTGGGRGAEVYPAAALLAWGLPHRGYKRSAPAGAAVRAAILAGLVDRFGLDLAGFEVLETPRPDDRLDALVSALVAREVARGRTLAPVDRAAAAEEGWIHVPAWA